MGNVWHWTPVRARFASGKTFGWELFGKVSYGSTQDWTYFRPIVWFALPAHSGTRCKKKVGVVDCKNCLGWWDDVLERSLFTAVVGHDTANFAHLNDAPCMQQVPP